MRTHQFGRKIKLPARRQQTSDQNANGSNEIKKAEVEARDKAFRARAPAESLVK